MTLEQFASDDRYCILPTNPDDGSLAIELLDPDNPDSFVAVYDPSDGKVGTWEPELSLPSWQSLESFEG